MQSFTCYLTPQPGSRLSVPVSLPAAGYCLIYGQVTDQGLPSPKPPAFRNSGASPTAADGFTWARSPRGRSTRCGCRSPAMCRRLRPHSLRRTEIFIVLRAPFFYHYNVRLYIQKSSPH